MICLYCTNEVTPASRLAHLRVCSSCAAVDETRNKAQVKYAKEVLEKCRTNTLKSSAQA